MLLPRLWASAASDTAHGAEVSARHQSLKLDRKPCVTASIPSRRSSMVNAMLLSGLPLAPGNTNPSPLLSSPACCSTSIARSENGTPMLAAHLHSVRRYRPGCAIEIDLAPLHTPDFTSPCRSQYHEFQGKASR